MYVSIVDCRSFSMNDLRNSYPIPIPISSTRESLGWSASPSSASPSPLCLGVDLPLVRDRGIRFGVEGAIRFRCGVVGTAVTGAITGATDGESTCMGFSPSSGNWSSVRWDKEGRDRYRVLAMVGSSSGRSLAIGVTPAATGFAVCSVSL